MKLFQIAFTGHREVNPKDIPAITEGVDLLRELGWEIPVVFHIGGASGFDTLVFSRIWPSLNSVEVLHIPFQYQADALYTAVHTYHDEPYKEWLNFVTLCSSCGPKKDYVRPVDNHLYQKRNEHMVVSSDLLVSYFNGQPSGTKNCIDYAKSVGVPVVDIRELTLDNLLDRTEENRRRGTLL